MKDRPRRRVRRAAARVLVLAATFVLRAALSAQSAAPGARDPVATAGFEHDRHARVACSACHGSGERHRTTAVRARRDCTACHHDPRVDGACAGCHERRAIAVPRTVERRLALSVWREERSRPLPFDHARHSDVLCRSCHAPPAGLTPARECTSCHGDHHRRDANCSACHPSPPPSAHDAASHLGCAGGGCHAPPATPDQTLSRNLCLLCHEPQASHETGRACAGCHHIPGVASQAAVAPARPSAGGSP